MAKFRGRALLAMAAIGWRFSSASQLVTDRARRSLRCEVYVLVKRDQYQAMRRLLEVEEIDPSLYEVEELELYEKT